MSSLRQVIVAISLLSGVVFLSGKPRIHYVEPLALLVGGTTEVTIHGDSLRWRPSASIWTNFDSEWIVLQDEKSDARKVRFQVSLPGFHFWRRYTCLDAKGHFCTIVILR